MDYNSINIKAENFVTNLFEKNQQETLLFHNLEHTRNVVTRANEIASNNDLSEKDQAILYISAWFHDTGHLFVEPAMHEVKSIELVKTFFAGHVTNDDEDNLVPSIEKCIMAARISGNPKTLPEQIMSDADTYHFGMKDFKKTNKLLRKEYILRKLITPHTNWNKRSLEFLDKHQYYTPYCKDLLEEDKQRNIEWLRRKILKTEMDVQVTPHGKKAKSKNPKEEKNNANLLGKGIQTMLRLTSGNHLDLSEMADRKANILISVNALIISVILSVLLRRLDVDTYLTIPTITFLVFSLVTIVIAILATLPKVSGGRFSKEDILNKKTNLLFFGNFHKATLPEYEWGMQQMMKDQEYLYGSLIKDIYYLGVILGKKYRLLRIAYYVFMVGIIISVLAFAVAVVLNKGGSPANSQAMPF